MAGQKKKRYHLSVIWLPFNNSEDFLQSLKTSLRGDIRRQIRRIEKIGKLRLVDFKIFLKRWKYCLLFWNCTEKRWPKAYKAPGFHENLLNYGLDKNIVHFTALRVNDKTMSYHLGFKFNHTYYYYMPAIDPQYENLSPGKIIFSSLVDYAIKNEFYDF